MNIYIPNDTNMSVVSGIFLPHEFPFCVCLGLFSRYLLSRCVNFQELNPWHDLRLDKQMISILYMHATKS